MPSHAIKECEHTVERVSVRISPQEEVVVIETAGQRVTTIYDNKYRFRDFLKPSFGEYLLGGLEAPTVSLLSFGIARSVTNNDARGLGYSLIAAVAPQVLTYLGARAVELFASEKGFWKCAIRDFKRPAPQDRVLSRTVEPLETLVE